MIDMTAALWDELSRINSIEQDVDLLTGEVSRDERLPAVIAALGDDAGDARCEPYTGWDGIERQRIFIACTYEGAPASIVLGRQQMWVE